MGNSIYDLLVPVLGIVVVLVLVLLGVLAWQLHKVSKVARELSRREDGSREVDS